MIPYSADFFIMLKHCSDVIFLLLKELKTVFATLCYGRARVVVLQSIIAPYRYQ
jgi:hypothetical protein